MKRFSYVLPCKRVRPANPLQDVFGELAEFAKNKTLKFASFAIYGASTHFVS